MARERKRKEVDMKTPRKEEVELLGAGRDLENEISKSSGLVTD